MHNIAGNLYNLGNLVPLKNNLNGILNIGLSTQEIRDKYKVIGQPITIILDKNGEIIYREYGYIPVNGF